MLVVGHLSEDRTPAGSRLGGAAAFAGLLAHRFGAPTAILTAVDREFPFLEALAGISIRRLTSSDRTRFHNDYREDGAREQRILSRAAVIPEAAIRRAAAGLPPGSAVLYAPVARELGGSGPLPRPAGEGSFAACAPQGLLRRWDGEGRVSVSRPEGLDTRLAGLDLCCLSAGEFEKLEECREEGPALSVPLLAITRGRCGAVLRRPGRPDAEVPPVPAFERDPTGAGDVFAAALSVSLWRGMPPAAAARLAAAAAAISVESPGTEGVPSLGEAASRLGRTAGPGR